MSRSGRFGRPALVSTATAPLVERTQYTDNYQHRRQEQQTSELAATDSSTTDTKALRWCWTNTSEVVAHAAVCLHLR
jgi:hypothetical protein